MKRFLLVLVGIVGGAVATFVFARAVMTGVGAGAGIATGFQAGACVTVEAAKEKGLITPAQVDEVQAAAAQIAAEDIEKTTTIANGDVECQKVIADLRAAATRE